MKKILVAAIAAVIASTSLGVATAAEAQSRYSQHYDRDDRDHRRADRRDDRRDRREYRQDRREDRREYRQERRAEARAYARWQRAQRRYSAPRYYAPRGHAVRTWSYGQRMPSYYRTNAYVVSDYQRYGLRRPPQGYHYVRSGNDVVLASVGGGVIAAVIASLFN